MMRTIFSASSMPSRSVESITIVIFIVLSVLVKGNFSGKKWRDRGRPSVNYSLNILCPAPLVKKKILDGVNLFQAWCRISL
jgi:hypothetical protein